MEASIRDDRKYANEEEDLDFFQSTIKVHERFNGNFSNRDEDEFFSDDESIEDNNPYKKDCFEKSETKYNLSPEAKKDTFSMLDSIRSYCQTSGQGLGLDVLNLKSDKVGLNSGPPFGDPLSANDIFDSALSLLDDRKCREFRDRGFFDGLMDESTTSTEAERLKEGREYNFEAKCHSPSLDIKMLEPSYSVCNSKPKQELDVSQDAEITEKQIASARLTSHVLPNQELKSQQDKIENISERRANNTKKPPANNIKPDSLSLDELVRYINGDLGKKGCSKKSKVVSSTSSTNLIIKKNKKQAIRKPEVASTFKVQTLNSPLSESGGVDSATAGNAKVIDAETNQYLTGVCDVVRIADDVTEHGGESLLIDCEERDGKDNFTTVQNKKRIKARKDGRCSNDPLLSDSIPKSRIGGSASSLARSEVCTPVSNASVASLKFPTSKSMKSDASTDSLPSIRGSFSSLDDSPPDCSEKQVNQNCPVGLLSKVSNDGSYASVLLKNLPKLSVNETQEIVDETNDGSLAVEDEIHILPSAQNSDPLLSPPQSEADTGFSSSSSLSPKEVSSTSITEEITLKNQEGGKDRVFEKSCVLLGNNDTVLEHRVDAINESLTQYPTSENDSLNFPHNGIFQDLTCNADTESSAYVTSCDSDKSSVFCRQSPVIFDTRTLQFACPTGGSDIVFGYDPADDGADLVSSANVIERVNSDAVDDVVGISFCGSTEGTSSVDAAKTSNCPMSALTVEVPEQEEGNLNLKPASINKSKVFEESMPVLLLDKKESNSSEFSATSCGLTQTRTSDQSSSLEKKCTNVSNHGTEESVAIQDPAAVNQCTIVNVEDSVREDGCSVTPFCFDILEAQKFLSKAYKDVLKLEKEHPDKIHRV